ncbi:MAG TPA: glycine oxidase ThiO [Candidatus Acidoferrum sp.]|nr:glycine oxidase ThiO [Candidatus Acidoferrum sp.]
MKSFDIVIVGGGIIGGAIAFELARQKIRVAVFDRQTPGQEASWAAAGMLSPAPDSADAIPLVPLARASLDVYPEFIATIEEASGQQAGFRPGGAIEAFFSHDAARELSTLIALHHGLGLPTEVLRVEEAQTLEPALGRDLGAAALLPNEASVDNRMLTHAVLAAAEASGAKFFTDCEVEDVLFSGNKCNGIVVAGEKVGAGHVAIAAGCWASKLESIARFAPTRPIRGQMVAMLSDTVDLAHVIRSERGYIVPRGEGLCVAGSTLENAGYEKRVTPGGIEKILGAVTEMIPALADAEIVETWSGLRPDTPDHLPSLGPVDVEGLLIATGHYRNGILLTPITAKIITDFITEGRASFPCDAYSPMRFADAAEASA